MTKPVKKSNAFEWFDPKSKTFAMLFPHLLMLRKKHSTAALLQRAYDELNARAGMALRDLGAYDPSLSDDVTQEVLLRLGTSDVIERYDPPRGSIEAFLYGIVRKVAQECLRMRGRSGPLMTELEANRHSVDPSEAVERKETLEIVLSLVEELPLTQRRAVSRKYISGLDNSHLETQPREYTARHRGLRQLKVRMVSRGL